ncbi:hypothetical protein [Janibacter indicus]|uniref:hypothetical protein n=1 Tax=Janibacter indicus TaxID=857417 RepID=UPI003D9A8E15
MSPREPLHIETLEDLLDALADPTLDAHLAATLEASRTPSKYHREIDPDLRDRRDALVAMRLRYNALMARGEVPSHLQSPAEQFFAEESRQIDDALGASYTTLDDLKWAILMGADRKELARIKSKMDKKDRDYEEASRILVQRNVDRIADRTKDWKGGPF